MDSYPVVSIEDIRPFSSQNEEIGMTCHFSGPPSLFSIFVCYFNAIYLFNFLYFYLFFWIFYSIINLCTMNNNNIQFFILLIEKSKGELENVQCR